MPQIFAKNVYGEVIEGTIDDTDTPVDLLKNLCKQEPVRSRSFFSEIEAFEKFMEDEGKLDPDKTRFSLEYGGKDVKACNLDLHVPIVEQLPADLQLKESEALQILITADTFIGS